jgi:hypothetical protein
VGLFAPTLSPERAGYGCLAMTPKLLKRISGFSSELTEVNVRNQWRFGRAHWPLRYLAEMLGRPGNRARNRNIEAWA